MNGSNGYAPANYGAPPQQPNLYGPPASQPPAYGAAPQGAYGAPPPQQGQQGGYGPSPYGAAPAPAYGPPQPQYPQQYPQQMMGNPMATPKNPGLAVALELLGGFFFQTFGIGHLYAGNIGVGLGLMFGYWVLTAINFALCFVFVGLITWPLTWLAFMILASITANGAAKKANAKASGMAF